MNELNELKHLTDEFLAKADAFTNTQTNKELKQFISQTADDVLDYYKRDMIECNEMYEMFINQVTQQVHDTTNYDCVILEYDEEYQTTLDMVETTMLELKGKTIVDFTTTTINDVVMAVILTNKGE